MTKHHEMAVVDTMPPLYSCACGFSSSEPSALRAHLARREIAEIDQGFADLLAELGVSWTRTPYVSSTMRAAFVELMVDQEDRQKERPLPVQVRQLVARAEIMTLEHVLEAGRARLADRRRTA